ncbi:MAG: MOSC domain-containing protein [Pseudonocardiaceae bacterium]
MCDAVLTTAGLTHDRSFMVIGEDGGYRSQRRSPRLALIHPEVSNGGEQLTLRAPGAGRLRADVDLASARRDVVLHGVLYQGIDQGDAVARWLSEVLGEPKVLRAAIRQAVCGRRGDRQLVGRVRAVVRVLKAGSGPRSAHRFPSGFTVCSCHPGITSRVCSATAE